MSSNNVLVTFEELSSMAARLQAEGGAIAGQLDSLLSSVQTLVESGWQGQAAGAFHTLYSGATQSWKGVETALIGMSDLLRNIGTQYQDQEATIAASLAG